MAYHHGNLRAALISAAAEILDESGAAGLSLRATARRAGVSHQAPYGHFRDADALIAAVAEDGFVALLDVLRAVRPETAAPERVMQALGNRYVRFAVENPGRFRVMFGPQLRRRDAFPGLAEAADRVFAVLSGPPAAGLTSAAHSASSSAGEVAGLSPRDPRALLWSVVHGLAHLLIDRQLTVDAPGVGEAEAFSLAVTEKLWFGLAPR